MNLPEFQRETGEWAIRNFGTEVTDRGLILAEEAGEVARALLKRKNGKRGTYEQWSAELRKETAEVFIALAALAHYDGFDLEEAVLERWAVIHQRDWTKDPVGHGMPEEET